MSRAEQLLHKDLVTAKGKAKAKAKEAGKAVKATSAQRDVHVTSIQPFISKAKAAQERVFAAKSIADIKMHEAAVKDMSTSQKGKAALALALELEEEYVSCTDLGEFVTATWDFLRSWKAYAHTHQLRRTGPGSKRHGMSSNLCCHPIASFALRRPWIWLKVRSRRRCKVPPPGRHLGPKWDGCV